MTEQWLVEAGLNMVNLKGMRGMPHAPSTPPPRPPTRPTSESLDRPRSTELHKKLKVGTSKMFESAVARATADRTGGNSGERASEEAMGSARGKERAGRGEQVYSSPSEVLIDKAANQHYHMAVIDRMQDASQVINSMGDKITELRDQIEELKAGATPEAIAAAEQ
ncbi:unnamed protein product, partial [Musa textilis]